MFKYFKEKSEEHIEKLIDGFIKETLSKTTEKDFNKLYKIEVHENGIVLNPRNYKPDFLSDNKEECKCNICENKLEDK